MALRVLLKKFGVKSEMKAIIRPIWRGWADTCQTECHTPTSSSSNNANKISSSSNNNSYSEGALHPDLQEALNLQLHTELTAAYSYMALEAYFERQNVGLSGFARAQRSQASEELSHALVLAKLLTTRSGIVRFRELYPPQPQEWPTPLEAIKAALQIETTTAKGLGALQNVAHSVGDLHVAHTIQAKLVDEQMECIHKLTQFVGTMEECSSPTCLLIIDQQLQQQYQ